MKWGPWSKIRVIRQTCQIILFGFYVGKGGVGYKGYN